MKQQELIKEKELHLIVLWDRSRIKQKEILEDIKEKFVIQKAYEITWDKELIANNFTRFYGVNLPANSFKEIECGKGPFLLLVVYDNNPIYGKRLTSRGMETVNTNLFDAKTLYREWTGGGHKIHATNNPAETNHDLTLLLGVNTKDYLLQHPSTEKGIERINQNIVGANGWDSLKQVFYVLNNTVEYVVLRGKNETLNDNFSDEHRDIDIFVTRQNYSSAVFIINGVSACSIERPHILINIGGFDYYLDMWEMEHYYFDWDWSLSMLCQRKMEQYLYVLDDNNEFYNLLYHCLIFKGGIAPDYLPILIGHRKRLNLERKEWAEILVDFINTNRYHVTVPTDKSIKLHTDEVLEIIVHKYGKAIKYLHSAQNDSFTFESAVYEKECSFVKYGTSFLIDNEKRLLEELSKCKYVPKVLSLVECEDKTHHIIEISRIAGVDVNTFFADCSHHHFSTIVSFLRQCVDILLILKKHHIYHRDLTPTNLLVSEGDTNNKCHVGLIDFGWAVKDEELTNCITPDGLGGSFAIENGISDIFSIHKIINELPLPDVPYVINIKVALQDLIEYEKEGKTNEVIKRLKKIKKFKPVIEDYNQLTNDWRKEKAPIYIRWQMAIDNTVTHFRKCAIIRRSGLKEGKNFSSERYLTAYPDIQENALMHYFFIGKKENRFLYTTGDMGAPKAQPTDSAPLISFVVTSFNYAHLITETLDSLINQTYKNFEIVVVDDGSKDNSLEVIQNYVNKYPFIHLFTHPNHENRGLPASMRLGIEKATGEYVAFCESDDYLRSDYLQKKVDVINKYSDVVIISNGIKMFGNEKDIHARGWVCQHIRKLLKTGGTPVDMRYNQEFNFIPTLSSVMIRKDVLVQLDYNTPVPAWLDFWLYRQILIRYVLYFVDEELTFWRQHNSFNGLENSSKVVNQLGDFLRKSNQLIGI